MVLAPSVAGLFKWRQFEPEVILLAVGWYLRFSLSYLMWRSCWPSGACTPTTSPSGGGSNVTPQKFSADCDRGSDRPTTVWRGDETYIRVKGKWVYLYRAVDSTGATIDFVLSAKRETLSLPLP